MKVATMMDEAVEHGDLARRRRRDARIEVKSN